MQEEPRTYERSSMASGLHIALCSMQGFQTTYASINPVAEKGGLMDFLLAALDFLFGCHHKSLSRVFTLDGQTYRVCCDCGARFGYSLQTMSIERRLFWVPVLTRLRIA